MPETRDSVQEAVLSSLLIMTDFMEKWKSKPIQPDRRLTIDNYFEAASKLDTTKLQLIIDSGQVDVNSLGNFWSGENCHMKQSFFYSSKGKVTATLFQNIDNFHQSEVKIILQVLQVKSNYV